MYKVIIVDDEQIVLDAMTFILDKRGDKNLVIDTASSGREAIEKAIESHPDIVFIDIRMPGLSGIDTITEIKTVSPNTKFVIVSAYEQFEYAKQAVQLAVFDYLLKPINRHKVNSILDTLMHIIDGERSKKRREIDTLERLNQMRPFVESSLIYAMILSRAQTQTQTFELEHQLTLLGLQVDYGSFATLDILPNTRKREPSKSDVLKSEVLNNNGYQHIRTAIKHTLPAIVGPKMSNRIVFFIPGDRNIQPYEARLEMVAHCEKIVSIISDKLGYHCHLGIGNGYPLQEAYFSYQESLKAIAEGPWQGQSQGKSHEKSQGHGVCHVADLYYDKSHQLEEDKLMTQLLQSVSQGKSELALYYLDRLLPIISARQEKLMELAVLLHRGATEAGLPEDSLIDYRGYLLQLNGLIGTEAVAEWLAVRVMHIAKKMMSNRAVSYSFIVERCCELTKANYKSELTLEGVSRTINVSPQYLSKLFKEQIGITFIDYLTSLRVEEAKRLMANSGLSVKEICFMVGYTDPNYFSRVFRKETGMTPTDFHKDLRGVTLELSERGTNHG